MLIMSLTKNIKVDSESKVHNMYVNAHANGEKLLFQFGSFQEIFL